MSWNIDGLDGRSLATRMKAVAQIVKRYDNYVFRPQNKDRAAKKFTIPTFKKKQTFQSQIVRNFF